MFVPRIVVTLFHRKPNRRMIIIKKTISLLPHLFTLGNAFFGYLSIICAAKGEFVLAAYFILLGALLDFLDGRVARLLGVASYFGVQLDSFGDLISFCLAPALLMYFWQLNKLGFIGILVTALFLFAGLLRLARFNLTSEQQTVFFLGVPSTIAGCFFATVLLNSTKLVSKGYFIFFLLFLELLFAFLMISSIKFPAFKQKNIRLKRNWIKAVFLILFAFIAVMRLHTALLLLFLIYFISSLFFLFKQSKFIEDED